MDCLWPWVLQVEHRLCMDGDPARKNYQLMGFVNLWGSMCMDCLQMPMIQCCSFFIMYRTYNSVFGADAGQIQELIIRVLWFRIAFPQLGVFRGSFLSVLEGRWQCAVLTRPHRNGVSWCVGGIPSIEFEIMGFSFQTFERDWSHVQDSQDLIRRISMMVRHASFPKVSISEILRFVKFPCVK